MFIDGFGISPFRSFYSEHQRIGPLKKVNLLIGQNNSGKSNVLRFAKTHLTAVARAAHSGTEYRFEGLDRAQSPTDEQLNLSLALNLKGPNFSEWRASTLAALGQQKPLLNNVEKVLGALRDPEGGDTVWFTFKSTDGGPLAIPREAAEVVSHSLHQSEWNQLFSALNPRQRFGNFHDNILRVLHILSPAGQCRPSVELVPAIREVRSTTEEQTDWSGLGLVNQLAQRQNPGHDERELLAEFSRINEFLRCVTENRTARLEIPYARTHINVAIDGRILPLDELGTGIHEVVIIAAAATLLSDTLICLEEPEIHLHPILQRKLIEYLENETSNQYLIATHSAHLLDAVDAGIFHIQLENGSSRVHCATLPSQRSEICEDLGYTASDLLQSNCVIWVEGPSDRIYLRHWLGAVDPGLRERVHYTIMFYGGKLLSHLSVEDSEIESFIALRRLNRNLIIVIDSDRKSEQTSLNETKLRVCEEFKNSVGFAWVTAGREIENYVPLEIFNEAIRDRHRGVTKVLPHGRYGIPLRFTREDGKLRRADKVRVAQFVTEHCEAELDLFDLAEKVGDVARFVRSANGMPGKL